MRWFRFFTISLVALVAACSFPERSAPLQPSAPPPVLSTPTLFGGQWNAFSVAGVVEIVPPKPTLRWIRTDRVEGSGGCNGFSALANPQGVNLRFTNLMPMGKPCMTLPGGQEDKFFKALERARTLRFEGDAQLVLLDDDARVVARFARSP
jgi:heat shock protein HslJ